MATSDYELADPPPQPRARELWLQHAAGFIVFEDVRRYALERIDPGLSGKARAAAEKAIDDAVYGMMMVVEGVTGGLANERHKVFVDFIVRLVSLEGPTGGTTLAELDLSEGDGMCMGFHGWREGDFGKHPIASPRSS